MIQTIYTKSNWDLLIYLWPNGTYKDDTYTVWLDCYSDEYHSKLAKLKAHSEYLAIIVHSHSDVGCLILSKGF